MSTLNVEGLARSPFNRTIVELKLVMIRSRISPMWTFNRTIVELKYQKRQYLPEESCF